MKNLFFALALIFTTSLSFANEPILNGAQDCVGYAVSSADAEEAQFGEMNGPEWWEAYTWYLDLCNEEGGALNPIFLK